MRQIVAMSFCQVNGAYAGFRPRAMHVSADISDVYFEDLPTRTGDELATQLILRRTSCYTAC